MGIDFGFLTIDWFGAFFSLMAIGEFDAILLRLGVGTQALYSCAVYFRPSWWRDVCSLVGFGFARCAVLTFCVLMLCSATIEASIFLSQAVWLFRTRKIRQRAKDVGLEWDEFPEAQAWQEDRWRLPWNWKKSTASAVDERTVGNAADAAEDGHVPIDKSQEVQDQGEDIEQSRPR